MKGTAGIIVSALVSAAVLLAAPLPLRAGDGALSAETQRCLTCHGTKGIIKKFENNEGVAAYVDARAFAASVHHALACADCHDEFSEGKHPDRRFRSKEQFRIKSARQCLHCHKEEQIGTTAAHAGLLKQGNKQLQTCTNCHGSHAITRVEGLKRFVDEEKYCMGCHRDTIAIPFTNGETLQAGTSGRELRGSVHAKLSCSDCHFGFSHEDHPRRNFRSRREFSLALSENCRRCHYDKYTKTTESIHYLKLSQGEFRAPTCTDCHGFHGISHFALERTLIAERCRKCHPGIYDIYAKSVHGKALFSGHDRDVPVCIDCHSAHDIRNPLAVQYHEKIPEMCGNCHANKAIADEYGLSTNVVKTYLSDFHGVTLKFYQKQREKMYRPLRPMAVCTDCHGTHNISSTRGIGSAAVRANLVKRCQQCHKDAGRNFPDAWLSHYEPSLKKAPLVYMINLIYAIFMPVMITGFFLQIGLHLWRYARNR
jgi:predicted CXXCH cytochrome family protein